MFIWAEVEGGGKHSNDLPRVPASVWQDTREQVLEPSAIKN